MTVPPRSHDAKLLATPVKQTCLCAAATAQWGKALFFWRGTGADGVQSDKWLGFQYGQNLLGQMLNVCLWILMNHIVPNVGDRLRSPLRQCENVSRAHTLDSCVTATLYWFRGMPAVKPQFTVWSCCFIAVLTSYVHITRVHRRILWTFSCVTLVIFSRSCRLHVQPIKLGP